MTYELSATSWGQEEVDALQRVIRSGRYTMGEEVRLFEAAFAAKFGVKHAVMTNSGSSANLVGVAALAFASTRPLQRGDEVIVPSHLLGDDVSSAAAVRIEASLRRRRAPDAQHGRVQARSGTDVADQHGRWPSASLAIPRRLDVMRAFCDKHDLILFEDNCESMGASLNGRPCGTFGDIDTFSTFYSHHISTMEGGLLVTNDTEIDHLARAIRNHGWARDLPADSALGTRHGDPFFEAYRFVVPGYNVRPLEMCGGGWPGAAEEARPRWSMSDGRTPPLS